MCQPQRRHQRASKMEITKMERSEHGNISFHPTTSKAQFQQLVTDSEEVKDRWLVCVIEIHMRVGIDG